MWAPALLCSTALTPLTAIALAAVLAAVPANAGSRGYDLNKLLYQPHPFAAAPVKPRGPTSGTVTPRTPAVAASEPVPAAPAAKPPDTGFWTGIWTGIRGPDENKPVVITDLSRLHYVIKTPSGKKIVSFKQAHPELCPASWGRRSTPRARGSIFRSRRGIAGRGDAAEI
jgi:hypothetical protein